jgi:DNA polymerase-4
LSLDEAYLDVTKNKIGLPSASLIAQKIRQRIFDETGLTASAGISINKFIAKVASDYNKPNGQKTVNPEDVLQFLEDLDIRKFYGVGKVTAEKMYQKGIFTGKDLKLKSLDYLDELFGKSGRYYYDVVRGIHTSDVKPNRIRKSLAAERTFSQNLSSEIFLLEKLEDISEEVSKRLNKSKVSGKTLTLKIKYSDFILQTRSKTLPYYVSDKAIILETAKDLLYQEKLSNSVRLLGISLSNLNTNSKQPKTLESDKKTVHVQLKFEF